VRDVEGAHSSSRSRACIALANSARTGWKRRREPLPFDLRRIALDADDAAGGTHAIRDLSNRPKPQPTSRRGRSRGASRAMDAG
jgi:hypothetical protein